MKKIIMAKGLPGSGKTTWAKKIQATCDGHFKRVNKDDLRDMLDNGVWSKKNEKFILKARDLLIEAALTNGYSVICDDTNFAPIHEANLREMAAKHGVDFESQDMSYVPLQECIENDLKRLKSVGKDVIMSMHNKYLCGPKIALEQDESLPKAVIFDLDGTLALMNGRGPFDWHKVGEDKLNPKVFQLYKFYQENGYKIIIMSGRDGSCVGETSHWLLAHGIDYELLVMRDANDNRKDSIIKRELFDEHVRNKFYIEVVIDDRNQVVEMWRTLGLTCFQVAEGNF